MRPSNNTLKDSFYKERLIKSNATSFYNTFTRTHAPNDSTDQEGEDCGVQWKLYCGKFGKVQDGQGYGFLSFECTHKMIPSVKGINEFRFLQDIDLSYNKLRSLRCLSGLTHLLTLKATNNNLSQIPSLKHPPLHLQSLDLSNNKITHMSNLAPHKYLRYLNLKANEISAIGGISGNLGLEVLVLEENKIEEIDGLDGLGLKELYLASNCLSAVKGMTKLDKLRVLDLSMNKIRKLTGLSNLSSLRMLKLSKNNIKNLREMDNIQNLTYLSSLDLCFNPIQQRRYYRTQTIYKLIMLQTLDGTALTAEEVAAAEDFYGLYVEEKFNIFKRVLPEEEFIDRRIHRSQLVQNQTDSQGETNNFVDDYDQEGRVRSNSSRSKNKSFNASKRSGFSKNSRTSKKSSN